jgi:amino acid transporter
VTLVLSWVAALVIAAFSAWVTMRGAEGSDSYRAGYVVGAVVFPFLIAAILRLVWVRIQRGRFSKAALRSPWLPLVAALLLGFATAGRIAALAPPPPVDAATAMHVSTPFTLQAADPAVADEIERLLRQDETIGSIAMRNVVGGDGSLSLLIAADARLAEDDLAEVAGGMEDSAGVAPTIETLAGREVAIITTANGLSGTWIDAPLLMTVYAADLPTLRAVVEAVVGSG